VASATFISARGLAAKDDSARAYFLTAWVACGAAYVARPASLEFERPDLRNQCVLGDSALLPLLRRGGRSVALGLRSHGLGRRAARLRSSRNRFARGAGFLPWMRSKIATLNRAGYLGRDTRIGSIAVGKNADLVTIKQCPI
jgi:hypothetical protein